MVPRARASEEVLARRREAVAANVTTTHRPHLWQPSHEGDTFRALPPTAFDRYAPPPPPPRLDRQMRLMVGHADDG